MGYRELAQAPAEVKQAVTDAARRIGFRFVLTQLRCNKTLRLREGTPSRLLLEHHWKNEGVAPCYASYALRWTLADSEGKAVAEQLTFPVRPTTVWRPGEEVTLKDVVTIPAGVRPGVYRLKVAMVEPEHPSVRIQLAIGGRDNDGAYDLCPISAEKHAAGPAVVYEEGFEHGPGGWRCTEGMTAGLEAEAHSGKSCLRIAGTQPGTTWNYAHFNLAQPVLPASRYQLSCWMRVDKITPKAPAPYLKIGLADASGKWLTNAQTNAYDLGRLGTWQHLVAFVETTPNTAGGHLAIEKGALEGRFDASLALDDVRFELLESP